MNTAHAQHTTPRDVWQDKYARSRVRAASDQPVMDANPPRTPSVNTAGARTHKRSTKRRLCQIASWVDDPLMLQLKEHARSQKLSMSEAVRGLLREIMLQKLEKQQAAALPELIERAVGHAIRRMAAPLATFLVRLTFDVGQIKTLSTNTLGMQEGVTEELLKNILADADRRTRGSLSRKNPKLTLLIKAVEEWLLSGEDGLTAPQAPHGKKEGTAPWP